MGFGASADRTVFSAWPMTVNPLLFESRADTERNRVRLLETAKAAFAEKESGLAAASEQRLEHLFTGQLSYLILA